MELLTATNLLTLVFALVIVPKILEIFWVLVWRPIVLTRRFKNQGVSGPKYNFLYGNLQEIKKFKAEAKSRVLDPASNDIFPHVFPHLHQWMSQYGGTFVYWRGPEPKLCISDPEIAKQILLNMPDFSAVPKRKSPSLNLFGKGLAFTEGLDWKRHRKILRPAFTSNSVKAMTKVMVNCTLKMIEDWRKLGELEKLGVVKVEGYNEFQILTAEIIAGVIFGDDFQDGIDMFKTQIELLNYFVDTVTTIFIPGARFLPTPANFQVWKLDRKVKNLIKRLIDERLKSDSNKFDSEYGDDLLGAMLRSEDNQGKLGVDEIIDECKTFFFSGHGTTSLLLTWTMMLLSLHQNWQEKLRDEVFRECGKDKNPDPDTFSKLKLMNLVLMESLRLYSPSIKIFREATRDAKIGDIEIPKGMSIFLLTLKMHNDKAFWGDDVDKFNPMRFENGVSVAANHPNAFLAFSTGPRTCIGQNFVMIEAKTVLTLILQRFQVSLASEYVHAPVDHLDLHPRYGLPLMIQPLDS